MNRFTIPRDIYFGENALEVLNTVAGKKALIVIGGGSVKRTETWIKLKDTYRRLVWKRKFWKASQKNLRLI